MSTAEEACHFSNWIKTGVVIAYSEIERVVRLLIRSEIEWFMDRTVRSRWHFIYLFI